MSGFLSRCVFKHGDANMIIAIKRVGLDSHLRVGRSRDSLRVHAT